MDSPKSYVVLISKDQDICPVSYLRRYLEFSSKNGINLNNGFLFRIQDIKSKAIIDKSVTTSSMSERLKTHLSAIGMYQGESGHSMRRGCAITLRLLGVDDASINQHIGWGCPRMVDHYANIGALCGPNSAASALSAAAENERGSRKSKLVEIASFYNTIGNLRRFFF